MSTTTPTDAGNQREKEKKGGIKAYLCHGGGAGGDGLLHAVQHALERGLHRAERLHDEVLLLIRGGIGVVDGRAVEGRVEVEVVLGDAARGELLACLAQELCEPLLDLPGEIREIGQHLGQGDDAAGVIIRGGCERRSGPLAVLGASVRTRMKVVNLEGHAVVAAAAARVRVVVHLTLVQHLVVGCV